MCSDFLTSCVPQRVTLIGNDLKEATAGHSMTRSRAEGKTMPLPWELSEHLLTTGPPLPRRMCLGSKGLKQQTT